ncbi:MAG: hypothetical protein A2Y15_07210 [Clostridiales bacterium GWF2_36_10]|nr:MAG: hypothetical protein A2Y15_07210 [Clostridiales bacterium GWF2_36_10]HAN21326.1 hypothetical protein [Clostridiales bacterium]
MLHRVMGRAGSGKTEYMLLKLEEAFRKGRKCLYIVPEQQSLSAEKKLSEFLGDGYNMSIEVLNFERLPNRIAREYGNLAVKYIDDGGRDILMSLTLDSLADKLGEYKNVSANSDFVKSIISVINRLKASGVSYEKLSEAAENGIVKSNGRLYSKLKDISIIYESYQEHFSQDLIDPCDALTMLESELAEYSFFKDYIVFIDGYYTFTEQEYAIIMHIVRQSEDTYISFTCDNQESALFKDNLASANRIKRHTGGVSNDIYTSECKRHSSSLLSHIEKYLWEVETSVLGEINDSVRIIEAKNSFEEAEAIASEIIRLSREKGLRYRDISLVFGGLSEYEGIIDVVLERNNIPFYMSKKDELSTKPLLSFIFACLEAVITDFTVSSIKKFIKTGFTPLSVGESDILLRYAEMWDIRGKKWYDGSEWQMNPDGYCEVLSSYSEHILLVVNRAKEKIMPYLSNLRQTLIQKDITISSAVEALYKHLIDCEADKRLLEKAQYLRDKGDEDEAQKERQLWDMLMNIFDQLYKISGTEKVNASKLYELLKLMCDEYTVGSIPTSIDQIRIGDASLFRPDDCKAQILGGVIDGVFPAYASGDNFFEDDELMLLEEAGCNIGVPKFEQQNRERFLFYTAAAAPSDYLILTYPVSDFSGTQKRPSLAITRIKKLLPLIKTIRFGQDQTDLLYSKESAAFFYQTIKDNNIKIFTHNLLINKGVRISQNTTPLFDKNAYINMQEKQISFSPSRIERYGYCAFSYFAGYVLRLKKNKKIKFSTPEIGTFIHKILEQFLIEKTKDGVFSVPSEEEIKEVVNSLAEKYFLDVVGGLEGKSRRFTHTYTNLKKTLNLLLHNLSDEFSQSDFLPVGFELKIGYNEVNSLPPVSYDLGDEKKVVVRGSIDRVDTYTTGGITYVRVVDYKTFGKEFSLDLINEGIDTQMLNYLFAYCAAGDNRKPAGILYYAAKLPTINIDGDESDDEIKEKLHRKLKRTGVILKDQNIVLAMDKSGSGAFIPVKIKKDGTYHDNCEKRLLESDGFSELEKKLSKQIISLAERVFDGDMCINPKRLDDIHDACKYCDYKAVCRYTE